MTAAILFASAVLSSTVFDTTFDRANLAYRDGDFGEAVFLYEQLVADGVEDAGVFYNLGNAYFRMNRLGPAIANYERVIQIDPNFESARQNLRLCVDLTPRSAGRPLPPAWEQSLLFWHYGMSTRTSVIAAALVWVLAWSLLVLRLFRPVPYTRAAALASFVLAALFTASVLSKTHPLPLAVADQAEVPIRFDRNPDSPVHFKLLEGDRVAIEARAPGWLQIVAPSGERGWAERNGFALVGPPYERPANPPDDSDPSAASEPAP